MALVVAFLKGVRLMSLVCGAGGHGHLSEVLSDNGA